MDKPLADTGTLPSDVLEPGFFQLAIGFHLFIFTELPSCTELKAYFN